MNSETHTEGQEKAPTTEQPSSSAPQPGRGRRHGRGRSRFKRGSRDDRPPRRDQPQSGPSDGAGHAPQGHGHSRPAGSIGKAIDEVEGIRAELQRALEDIEEVLRTLEQVDREKSASEEEIDMLRESLRLLQREPGQGRYARNNPPSRPAASEPVARPEPTETPEDED